MAQLVFHFRTAKQDYEKKTALLSFDGNLRVRSQSKVMIKQSKAEGSAGNPSNSLLYLCLFLTICINSIN